jgi:PadR family transcriptional regulator, regulatory protein PadR
MGSSRRAGRRPTQEVRARLLRALVTPFVLHRALQGPVYGWTLRKTLLTWGCPISAGSLYPLLNAFERDGLLRGYPTRTAGCVRKYSEITEQGSECHTHFCRVAAPVLREILLASSSGTSLHRDTDRHCQVKRN